MEVLGSQAQSPTHCTPRPHEAAWAPAAPPGGRLARPALQLPGRHVHPALRPLQAGGPASRTLASAALGRSRVGRGRRVF